MKAFILAAGLGTRLVPLTLDKPKALVELHSLTLLERTIRKVSQLNPSEIIVNIHHFGNMIIDYLAENENFNFPITISDERDQLLDTGGAILNARQYLGEKEPFLIYNVDVLSSVDLAELYAFHEESKSLATLSVRKRQTDRNLLFDENMYLTGWRNRKTGEERVSRSNSAPLEFAFSGIHIMNPEIFPLISETGKFSVIDLYLRLAKDHCILGHWDESAYWMDLGKPDQLQAAAELIGKYDILMGK